MEVTAVIPSPFPDRFFILLLARFRNGEVGIIGYAAVISSLASVAGVGR
jgi:hypothetical protein